MVGPIALRAINPVQAARPAQRPSLAAPSLPLRPAFTSRSSQSQLRKARDLHVVRAVDKTETVDVDAIVKDLQAKWDGVENKTSVVIYAGGAVVLLWLSSSLVGAVNAVPLLPKLLELVGLGYTAWFVYRYLLFKSSREELLQDIDELKKKVSGVAEDAQKSTKSRSSF